MYNQKLRTRSSSSNNTVVPASGVHRHSLSADRDNRLLLLHRKCSNPLVCVRGSTSNSPPLVPLSAVPLVGCSPILCRPLPCKPRLRPVTSFKDAAEICVVGSGVRDSCVDSPLPSSHLPAKQHQLRRKVYSDKSHSADGGGGRPRKQSCSEGNVRGKGRAAEVYIPTASGSLCPKPPLGSRRLSDKVVYDMTGVQQSAYYTDAVQWEGGLKMEHVENPRPLPPRYHILTDDDNNEISLSPSDRLHSRPGSVFSRRCVTDTELRPSRHLVCEQPSDSNSYERPACKSPPVDPHQRVFSVDSGQTFYRVSEGRKQNPNNVGNSRTVFMDSGMSQRCSSGQPAARKRGRQQLSLKKSISDVGRQISQNDGDLGSQDFSDNARALPRDDSCEFTDSCSIHDKYVTLTLMLANKLVYCCNYCFVKVSV